MFNINTLLFIVKTAIFIIILFIIYEDTNNNFRSFLKHTERKFLVIHSIKLFFITIISYTFKFFSPYNSIISIFSLLLLIIFLLMLSLKQAEMSREKFKELRAFKYNKLSEIFLILFASFFNIIELFKQKGSLKEKYKQMMYIAIFPVQKYIAVSITGVEFTNRKDKFITDEQLTDIENELLPGDILLKRNDWQATNLGIPGFWTHAGLYIGSIEKMDDYFIGLDSLNNQKFSDLLRSENKKLYLELLNDSSLSVIEAIEDGVSLRPLSNIAKVDYFCALRPIVREQIKANAVKTAFGFVGRPYDYHFNIESDNAFVCSELIQKAYGASINIPSIKKLGKRLILPNSIAKKYSKERMRRNKELDFVLFYDLDVRSRKAYKSTEKEFSKSHRRNLSYYKKQDIIRYLSTIVDL